MEKEYYMDDQLSIKETACIFSVSESTIRNWIKTGYLSLDENNFVTLESINNFKKQFVGREKLNKRANKSFRDNHNHKQLIDDIYKRLNNITPDLDQIGQEYENQLSNSYRNKEGVYYTPDHVIDRMFQIGSNDISNLTFCDPCCGSGNFVIKALSLGFKPENIYAYDIDPVAVELTKKRILHKSGFDSPNVMLADFLQLCTKPNIKQFDYIFTNPPWGKKTNKNDRVKLGYIFNSKSSIDTCSLFLFACTRSLKEDGMLGLLLPESFFNIYTFEDARKHILDHNILKFIDFGKVFNGLITKAQAVIINKSDNHYSTCDIELNTDPYNIKRSTKSFRKNPKSIFNIHCPEENSNVINHIFSIPHITLKNNAQWGIGIVTGNNKKFVKINSEPGLIPVYRGSDITPNGLKKPTSFLSPDMKLYQQVAPIELYKTTPKIIYKFISKKICFNYDEKQCFILNSANMLIPNKSFPVNMKILCELFNSDFMNWIFYNIYNTHKILRADLESLPIHFQYIDTNKFSEIEYIDKLNVEKNNNGTYRLKK